VEYLKGLEEMTEHEHGHLPYILLLLHYLEKWKEDHEGRSPENYKDKTAFKEMVRAAARRDNAEGGEENFDEAVAAVMKTINAPSLRSNVRDMFELGECINPTKDSANFWVIASAIKTFYEKEGVLPLPGSVPDMKAQSADYIQLQTIYKSKARRDVMEVTAIVRDIEKRLERDAPIPDQEIEAFCKNAAHIKIIHGSSIPVHDTFFQSLPVKSAKKIINEYLPNPDSLFPIWLSFCVFDAIVNKSPGSFSTTSLADPERWKNQVGKDIAAIYKAGNNQETAGIDEEVMERVYAIAKEMQRSEGGELHNIAALTGGMVAQEAIKVVTRQYVPVDSTCIFDGVFSKSEVLKMG
jgi:amyloid beta precursor protein binding protein 1